MPKVSGFVVSVEPSKEPPKPTNSNRGNATTQVHQAGTFTQALHESLRWLSSHAGSESPLLNKNLKTISAVRVDPCDLPLVASHSKVSTGGRGRERREERKEERKGKECVPSYDTSVQQHTKRGREGFPAMTNASRDTQKKKEEGERKKNENRCSQLRASVQGHTTDRGKPQCYIQVNPKEAKREEGEGRGRKGTKVPTDSNES